MKRLHLLLFLLISVESPHLFAESRQFVHEGSFSDGASVEIIIVDDEAHEKRALETINRALGAIDILDRDFGTHPGNLREQLNQLSPKKTISLSEGYFLMFEQALELAKLTNGWFDITSPSQKGIFVKRDYRRVVLDASSHEVKVTKRKMFFDLRWFFYGTACNAAFAIIREAGFSHAKVTVGPVSKLMGRDIYTPWGLEVALPLLREDALAYHAFQYQLRDMAVAQLIPEMFSSTLIDPKTKKAVAPLVKNITVIAKDAIHALAFAVAIAPFDALTGIRYLEKFDGIEGVIVDQTGTLFISEGFQPQKKKGKKKEPSS